MTKQTKTSALYSFSNNIIIRLLVFLFVAFPFYVAWYVYHIRTDAYDIRDEYIAADIFALIPILMILFNLLRCPNKTKFLQTPRDVDEGE